MKTIWKFPLQMKGFQTIEMPEGAKILSVQPQGESVCLWALVESTNQMERRGIVIVGTGHDCEWRNLDQFIDTFQMMNGALIFHAFEERV